MKLTCDIVQDLLPLYEDGLCSETSREAIEEHLKECALCCELVDSMRSFKEPEIPESVISQEDKVIVKSFRKVHRRWIASLLAMLLVISVVMLSINQVRQEGICFTNVDEIWSAGRYVHALEQGNFEKAASYMDYEHLYNEIQSLICLEPEDFKKPFQRITLDGREWMVTEEYYQNFFKYEEDEQSIWSCLIYNMIPNVMIPTDVWEEMMALQPDVFRINEDGVYEKDGITYIAMQCEWGTFMVESTSGILQCKSAADFCSFLDLLPMEIYEEGKAEMDAEALKSYNYIQEKYEAVADMTVEKFEEFMREQYTNQLKECADLGYSVKITRLDESYYIDANGNWHIGYGAEISYGKNNYPVTLIFSVGDGKIRNLMSVTYKAEYLDEKEDQFIDALVLSYPL